jgi:hypothetical protein
MENLSSIANSIPSSSTSSISDNNFNQIHIGEKIITIFKKNYDGGSRSIINKHEVQAIVIALNYIVKAESSNLLKNEFYSLINLDGGRFIDPLAPGYSEIENLSATKAWLNIILKECSDLKIEEKDFKVIAEQYLNNSFNHAQQKIIESTISKLALSLNNGADQTLHCALQALVLASSKKIEETPSIYIKMSQLLSKAVCQNSDACVTNINICIDDNYRQKIMERIIEIDQHHPDFLHALIADAALQQQDADMFVNNVINDMPIPESISDGMRVKVEAGIEKLFNELKNNYFQIMKFNRISF